MSPERIFDNFPVIDVNDQFYLRQMVYDDTADYLAYLSDPETHRYVPEECLPRDMEQARKEIQYNLDLFRYKRSIFWGIARKDDYKLIGSCGFNYWNRDHSRGEISYDLAKPYWRKGVMSQVVRSVLGFAFTQMQMHRVEATVTPTNIGSLGVLKKAGFKKEGVLREQKLLHGKFYDAIILSLLQREFLGF
jgi:[ribosomal protein S5]-alanine N-acetyltransferase